MRNQRRTKIIISATAGLGALTLVAGNAFTAGGVYDVSGDGFVGGTVDQEVFGATITNVSYDLNDDDSIDMVTLTFANNATPSYPDRPSTTLEAPSTIEGKAVTIAFEDGDGVPVGDYDCTAITATVSACEPDGGSADSRDVSKITITVQEP